MCFCASVPSPGKSKGHKTLNHSPTNHANYVQYFDNRLVVALVNNNHLRCCRPTRCWWKLVWEGLYVGREIKRKGLSKNFECRDLDSKTKVGRRVGKKCGCSECSRYQIYECRLLTESRFKFLVWVERGMEEG